MYCLFCGTNLPDEALFCLKCGKLIPIESEDIPTSTAAFPPSDPLSSEAGTPNPYASLSTYTPPSTYTPLTPPPPPQYRRPSPGLLKGFLGGLLLILLLSGGIGILLLLKQGALSPSATQPAAVLYQADW